MKNQQEIFYQKPNSLYRLGETTFIQRPLYKAKLSFEPTYINEALFEKIFHRKGSWREKYDDLQKLFSITINLQESTGEQCGWAYIDRQGEDPYATSLMGNLGSGRAYYTGSCFNIKGQKTPLATSKNPAASSGILSTKDAIWSALIGNSLYEEFHVKPSPVLAILRIYSKHSIIIRIDEEGSLDRVSHLLYNPLPLTRQQLRQTAKNFGRYEADKFVHRILHGAWSAGNISLQGHLIDYDTVCAVKGRQLQFSYTPRYLDNYFGFESQGQLKILKTLCENKEINPSGVTTQRLEKLLYASFRKYLVEGFVYLMGFEDVPELMKQFKSQLTKLATMFYELSHYTFYVSVRSLFADYPATLFYHLFDFSALFRVYPLLKLSKQFSVNHGLMILLKSSKQQQIMSAEYKEFGKEALPSSVEEHIKHYLIHSSKEDSATIAKKIHAFVTDYDQLFDLMLKTSKSKKQNIAARAYVINEDRLYLFPVFSLEAMLVDLQQTASPKMIHQFIQHFIRANQRYLCCEKEQGYITDFRLYEQGYAHRVLTTATHCVLINLYYEKLDWEILPQDTWLIEVNHQRVPAVCTQTNEGFQIQSEPLSNQILLDNYSRETVFLVHPYKLYRNNKKVKLSDLFFPEKDDGYYF